MSHIDSLEDSISPSISTNISLSETILQDINNYKNKNIHIISKSFEQKIPDFLYFLQNNLNLAVNKIQIIKYLQELFTTVKINSEIFLRKNSSDKEKLNLYEIIINQYICYTNSSNFQKDEEDYRNELIILFDILLAQVSFNRESYHYILSFVLKYINEKNNNLSIVSKNINENEEKEDYDEFKLTADHLTRVLTLLQRFYQYIDINKQSLNYFFFSGESDSSIIIQNKNSLKDNKKLLTLEDNLCVLMFIKVFPSEYIKTVHSNTTFNLLELKFNGKNKDKDISINIDSENNLITNFTSEKLAKLTENDTNSLLIKFKKKKKIKVKLYLNGKKICYNKDKEKEKDRDKEEVKEIVLFKNFIGICYNFMLFKTKKKEIFPKFLENEFKKYNKELNPLSKVNYNGFINEESLFPFIKSDLKDEMEQNILDNLFITKRIINNNDIRDFLDKVIAIYIPSRVIIPSSCKNNILNNTPELIIEDSINGLDAEFITKSPALNGVHIYNRIINDFSSIGGLNNLLPIIEIMTQYNELLTKKNLGNFFVILISVFSPQYQNALAKEKNSNFFLHLSYFLEKIPEEFYDNSLTGICKSISSFLTTQINESADFFELTQQFHNYILMDERILFKFNHEEQKEIIEIISHVIESIDPDKKTLSIDIIKIIKILLHLDQDRHTIFCCKEHSEYFTENFGIMNPELYLRLQPIEQLLHHLFREFEEKVRCNDPVSNEIANNLFKLFTLVTYDVSPCIQKMIIRLFSSFLDKHFDNYFQKLNKEEQIMNICLFILKSSVCDIKKDILNLIFIILKYENLSKKKDLAKKNEHKSNFIVSNVLPFFLFEDKELLQITTKDNPDILNSDTPLPKSSSQEMLHTGGIEDLDDMEKLKNEYATNAGDLNLIEDYFEKEKEKDNNINHLSSKKDNSQIDIYNEMYGDDDMDNSKNKINGIKPTTIINDVKYSLPFLNKNLYKIYSLYDKKKLNFLIDELFHTTYKFFHEGISISLSLNLLTKIVARGDLLLVATFIENLNTDMKKNESEQFKKKIEEIYDNQDLLQFLIETCFQAKLIKDSKFDKAIFLPGFNMNVTKKDKEGKEEELDDKEKMEIINNIIKISTDLLKNIFNKNIYIMDYIFTWSKYFYELRNSSNNFKSVRKLVLDFMEEACFNFMIDCTNPDVMNNPGQKMTIYFFNLLFEFVTFYKLKQEDLDEYQKDSSIYQELSTNLKHILISKMDDCRDSLRPIDVQEKIDSKFDEYPFFKTSFDMWTPLWRKNAKENNQNNRNNQNNQNKQVKQDKQDNKNKQDKEIYKIISNKKNLFINELEILFYDFRDIKEFSSNSVKNLYVNKGIPLIYILYHFFTLIFSIGGTEIELRELFNDFRLFNELLVISTSTLSTPGIGKKKKWPSDKQYKNVQDTTEAILFNFLSFLFNKIKDLKSKINDYNEREQNLDDNEQKYLNYLNQIIILLTENLGYCLKILNQIYRGIKKEEEKVNYFKALKYIFSEKEGVKKSGGYKLIEKIYLECPNLSENPNQKNYLDEITQLNFSNPEFRMNSKTLLNNEDKEKNRLFIVLEEYITEFIEDPQIEQFFSKHSEEYKKFVFPFVSFISARKDAVKNIIPVYDNRPNITSYQKELCLIPDYFPQNTYDSILIKNIESVYKSLNTDLQLDEEKCQLEEQQKSHNYKKVKEKLFSFTGIWSIKEYFYNKKKYKIKYRLLNHMSSDMIRVLLTPIIDVDYYLPKFGRFNPINLFRKIPNYKSVCKISDLSFNLKKLPPSEIKDESKKDKKDKKEINVIKDNKDNKSVETTPIKESKNNEIDPNQNPKNLDKEIKEENNNKNIEEPNNDEENKNALYYISQENFSYMDLDKKKEETHIHIHEHLFSSFIQKKHSIDLNQYCIQINACLVRIDFHIRGIIFNNSKGIGFYSFESKRNGDEEDYDSDRKACFGSVFKPQIEKYNHYYINIPYHKIQVVLIRRYYFKKAALEIFTEDKKSYLFRIEETKIRFFIENIKYYMKQDIEDIFIEYNKFEDRIGFVNKKNIFLNTNMNYFTNEKKHMNLRSIYEKWSKWEISTLRLLMVLNIYSNRSYNDINQYPVFPWIITDYVSPSIPPLETKDLIRHMGIPMGMMDFTPESKERKENYIEHWISNEADEDREENYDRYGSHYSTSLYLTYYLVRVFPFSYIRIELQGKNFDDPNRLFNSLPNSFDCAITQKSDLRELIPEFFCFPEMFSNMNDLNLGEVNDPKGNPKLVGGVEMPAWANYNEYKFIEKHRELLECPEINEKINEWFNIIFGSKQKGKEAKKIGNLFIKQTYEDFEETYDKSNKQDKIYQCRMVEFGVTPNQLFKSDTYKRQNVNDCSRIKRSLLFHVLHKKSKKMELTGKELDIEEIKLNIEDNNISKMFYFIVKKKERKKERLYLLTNNKVKVLTKNDKIQFFKSTKEKPKIEKEKEKEKKEEEKAPENENDNVNIGEMLEENEIKGEIKEDKECEISTQTPHSSINYIDRQKEYTGKEQSKINIYQKYDKKYTIPRYRMNSNESPTILYEEGFFIAFGGFWNGDIIIKNIIENKIDTKKGKSKKINIIKTGILSPITKMIIDKTETIVICANAEGNVFIYLIDRNDKFCWSLYKGINEGQGEISSIAISENLGIFITCFKNGYCMVYTLPNCKLYNSFRIEEDDFHKINLPNKFNNESNPDSLSSSVIYSPDITFISESPLPCFVFYIKERKSLCVYSINAHFLKEAVLGYEIVENGIKKYTDFLFRDYLFVYNSINSTIDIYKLTYLELIISTPIINNQFIDFQFSKDSDTALILVKKNEDKSQTYKILLLKQSQIKDG